MAAIPNNNDAFFRSMFNSYKGFVSSIARKYFADSDTCDEVVILVFTKAFQKIDQYSESKGAMATWLGTITRNTCIDMKRSLSVGQVQSIDDVPLKSLPVLDPDSADSDTDRLNEVLEAALATISESSAEYIRRFYLKGWKYKEIADEYNVPVNRVGVEISRGLTKLRKALKDMNVSLSMFF